MKRIIVLFFAIIMMISLTACGKIQNPFVVNKSIDSVDEFNRYYDSATAHFVFDGTYYYITDGQAIYRILDPQSGSFEKIYESEDLIDYMFYSEGSLYIFLFSLRPSGRYADVLNTFDLKEKTIKELGAIDDLPNVMFRCGDNLYCIDPYEFSCRSIDLPGSNRDQQLVINDVWSNEVEDSHVGCIGVFGEYVYLANRNDGYIDNDSRYQLSRINIATKQEEELSGGIDNFNAYFWIGCIDDKILFFDCFDYRLSSLDVKTGQVEQYPFEFDTSEPGTIILMKDAYYFTRDLGDSYELCKYTQESGSTEVLAKMTNFYYVSQAGDYLMIEDNISQFYLLDLNDPYHTLVQIDLPH